MISNEIGTVVRLKSGGPQMVIEGNNLNTAAADKIEMVHCVWFGEDKKTNRASFDPKVLEEIGKDA